MSLKGTIRDSWDVWRAKVNAALGTVEQIDADEVKFDGTASGLSATNVQAAIDEVAGDIPEVPNSYAASAITYDNTESGLTGETAQSAIDEVASAIGNIEDTLTGLTGFYAVAGVGEYVEVTADGVKTNAELMVELTTALNSVTLAIEDNEGIIVEYTTFGATYGGALNQQPFHEWTKTNPYTGSGFRNTIGSGVDIMCFAVSLAMAVGDTQYIKQDIANGGTLTRTDMVNDVPANGTVHRVYYRKVKFL